MRWTRRTSSPCSILGGHLFCGEKQVVVLVVLAVTPVLVVTPIGILGILLGVIRGYHGEATMGKPCSPGTSSQADTIAIEQVGQVGQVAAMLNSNIFCARG